MIEITLLLAGIGLTDWLNMGIIVGTLLGGISVGFIVKKIKTWLAKKKDQLTSDQELGADSTKLITEGHSHREINNVLIELRNVMDAARAQVGQFHNGGAFLDGSPVKRFSISYESFRNDVRPTAPEMQNVLLSLFWDVIPVLKENEAVGRLVADQEEGYFQSILKAGNVYAFAILPLKKWHAKSKKSQIVGYVLVEWQKQENFEAQRENHVRAQLRNARSIIESHM